MRRGDLWSPAGEHSSPLPCSENILIRTSLMQGVFYYGIGLLKNGVIQKRGYLKTGLFKNGVEQLVSAFFEYPTDYLGCAAGKDARKEVHCLGVCT